MSDNFTKTFEKLKRQSSRMTINRIWNMIKEGDYIDLSQEEQNLAMVILNHQEYRESFEDENLLEGSEYSATEEFNPFLHISLHQMAEDQLVSENPVEAPLLYEYIEKMGHSKHTAIHVIIMILMNVIADSFRNEGRFNEDRYKRLLIKCRKVKPPEMQGVIEREFTSN